MSRSLPFVIVVVGVALAITASTGLMASHGSAAQGDRDRFVGAWRLASKNSLFGGYSALLATPGNTLTAFSDLGAWLAK